MARVRVRQHVNPLSSKYLSPISPPNWQAVYGNIQQPLHLDIGCAWGHFLTQIAPLNPECNFLGLEIREPLVEQALLRKDELGLTNLHFIACSANTSLSGLLNSLPHSMPLKYVTIQFPDPWFKNRHNKRRVVQPELVNTIAEYLVPGGIVFLQSDIHDVAEEMRDRFAEHSAFTCQHSEPWLASNPLQIPTERETSTLSNGDPVYRVLFTKT